MDAETIIREQIGVDNIRSAMTEMEKIAQEKEWELQQEYVEIPDAYDRVHWQNFLPRAYYALRDLLAEAGQTASHSPGSKSIQVHIPPRRASEP